MVPQKNKPWEEKWKIVRSIGGGGQGDTFLVEAKNAIIPHQSFVLKKLRNQNDAERRRRMHREVAALTTLHCPGIPRLIESNSEQFDSDVLLYMVTDFIEGKTLSQKLEGESIEISAAINLILKLLEIIEYCHNAGIVHRDIKPDNIIIRNDDLNNLFVIDFGISFNESDTNGTILTEPLQQLGNRFLALPELQLNSSLRRDPRSDITQCCGILFFMLTGLPPVTFLDHEGRKPHQRPENKNVLSKVPSDLLARVNTIFDRAFEIPIDRRWQSIPSLKEALMELTRPAKSQNNNEVATYLAQIQNKLSSSSDYALRQSFQKVAHQIVQEIHNVGRSVAGELGTEFSTIQTRIDLKRLDIDWANLMFSEKYGITNKFLPNKFFPEFRGYATGNEFVLLSELNGERIELLRVPLNNEPDFVAFRERLRLFYIQGVISIIGA